MRWLLLASLAACSAPPHHDDAGASMDAGVTLKWSTGPAMPRPQQECGVAALGGQVYAVGGFTSGGAIIPDVVRFDGTSWSTTTPLPMAIHHANVAAVNGKLYVVGTLEGGSFTARGTTLEFDPATSTWTPKTGLPAGQERGASAVGVIGTEIILAGGYRGGAVTDVTAYDTATDTHRTLASLPVATEHVVGAAVGTKLYVIGGRAGTINSVKGDLQIYDATTNTWSTGPELPTDRGGHAAAVVGTRIVVLGGEGHAGHASGVFPQVEVLDTEAMRWSRGPDMPTPRHGTGAAALGNRVVMPGGATVAGLGAVDTVEIVELGP